MKSFKTPKLIKVPVLLLIAGLFSVQGVLAYQIEKLPGVDAGSKDFVVGPGKIEITLNPGEEKTALIKVSNRLGETKNFHLDVEDFTGSTDPNQPVVLLGDQHGPYSLKDYISFPETDFNLNSGERATIPVTIHLPVDAEPGDLYGSVLVSVTTNPSEKEVGGGGSAIVSRIGTLFFVTIPGEVKKEGQVSDFGTIGNKRFFTKGPINFEILFENKSSVHLNPYGEISVKNMYGEEVGLMKVDPWFALPGSLRLRDVTWEREVLFGKYTATAKINRGYGDIIDTKEFTFYVVPLKWVAVGVIALALIIFLLRFVSSKFEIKKKN